MLERRQFILIIFCALLFGSCMSQNKMIDSPDPYLVIPGKSAEGYCLGDKFEGSVSVLSPVTGIISAVLNAENFPEIKFDSVFYMKESFALFLKDKVIVAIAGFRIEKHVTSDAVLLSKGVDNFILNYGNSGLTIIAKGNHKIYLYKKSGIAVFDDNSDNIIDMFLVFTILP
jgi:hypothetical protein